MNDEVKQYSLSPAVADLILVRRTRKESDADA
jgi:hypothetical protein